MKREEFYKITGEYPEDVIGPDWENDIQDMKIVKQVEYNCTEEADTLNME